MTTQDKPVYMLAVGQSLMTVDKFVAQWFGEPCAEYDPECIICQHWDAVNKLQGAYMDYVRAATTTDGE